MTSKRKIMPVALIGLALLAAAWWGVGRLPVGVPTAATPVGRTPAISPDYVDCVIPPNIAPLNFLVEEDGSDVRAEVHGPRGDGFVVAGDDRAIRLPQDKWRPLLKANVGGEIRFDVYVRDPEGEWLKFDTITNRVASEPVDPYLVYRLLGPLHNYWKDMGVYQRDLESFDKTPVLRSAEVAEEGPCFNCHTFVQNDPSQMSLQLRATSGPAMLIGRDGKLTSVDTRTELSPSPAAYTSWHPSGAAAAFSANTLSLQHKTAGQSREVFDANSDLGVYLVASNTVLAPRGIADPDYLETFPAWSHDGAYLYFSRAKRTWPADIARHEVPEDYKTIRYDLMRIAFDIQTGQWGEPEVLLAAEELGKTLLEARPSPDGRFLLFTTADYGNFPVWSEESDLHMLDLASGEHRRLAANSDHAETWHSWSSNGRWIVFSSKRTDGVMFARPHLSYIDQAGRSHKPVLVPQEDPAFYGQLAKTYNAPELATSRIPFTEAQFVATVRAAGSSPKATLVPAPGDLPTP